MKIALASPPIPESLQEGLNSLKELAVKASEGGAKIVCFPESYLPGYPGMGYSELDRSPQSLGAALEKACEIAEANTIAMILPMDWHSSEGLQNLAFVISSEGKILGYQTKNQLDPSEDEIWVPGTRRQIFEISGLKFGISICHEGFRYPESVRWAAQHGAHIVFHPHFAGSNLEGKVLSEWGSMNNPYYEKAMMMRSIENAIYFASVNYASKFAESASSVINPDGTCLAYQQYGEPGVLIVDIDPELATGFLAARFKSWLYNKD